MTFDDYLFRQMEDENPQHLLSPEQRLAELYAMIRRIAYGSGKPGDRPLAGGVETFAKKLLKRHGVDPPQDPEVCPCCGGRCCQPG